MTACLRTAARNRPAELNGPVVIWCRIAQHLTGLVTLESDCILVYCSVAKWCGVVKYQGHKRELSNSIALHHFVSIQIDAIDSVSDPRHRLLHSRFFFPLLIIPPYRWPGGQTFARLILRSTII